MLPSSTSSWQTFRQYHDSDFLAIGKSTLPAKVAEETFLQRWRRRSLVKVIRYVKRIARARRPFLGAGSLTYQLLHCSRTTPRQQTIVFALHGSIVFANACFLPRTIQYIEMTTPLVDQASSQNDRGRV